MATGETNPPTPADHPTQAETGGDDVSSDWSDDVEAIYTDSPETRGQKFDEFEDEAKAIRAELDSNASEMSPKRLEEVDARFRRLIQAVRAYGVIGNHVSQSHQLFLCFEEMWEIVKIIRMRTVGSLDVRDGLPRYTYEEAYIRKLLLRAHHRAPLPFCWIPFDRLPFPDHFYMETS